MTFKIDGLIGIIVFAYSLMVFGGLTLIGLATHFWRKKRQIKAPINNWSKSSLFSALVLLSFDGIFYLFITLSGKEFAYFDGEYFDWMMIYIWIPSHIIAYFIIIFALRYFWRSRSGKVEN